MTTRSKHRLAAESDSRLPFGELLAILGLFYAAILLAVLGIVGSVGPQALIGAMDVLPLGDPIVAMAFTA